MAWSIFLRRRSCPSARVHKKASKVTNDNGLLAELLVYTTDDDLDDLDNVDKDTGDKVLLTLGAVHQYLIERGREGKTYHWIDWIWRSMSMSRESSIPRALPHLSKAPTTASRQACTSISVEA
jgi:hypothetical protein